MFGNKKKDDDFRAKQRKNKDGVEWNTEGGWMKNWTDGKGGVFQGPNHKAFKEMGYPVPTDQRPGKEGKDLHSHEIIGPNNEWQSTRDLYGDWHKPQSPDNK